MREKTTLAPSGRKQVQQKVAAPGFEKGHADEVSDVYVAQKPLQFQVLGVDDFSSSCHGDGDSDAANGQDERPESGEIGRAPSEFQEVLEDEVGVEV